MRNPSIWIAAIALWGCSPSMPPLPDRALIISSCPELTPLQNDSFGATSAKLVEVAGIYYQCRTAALGVELPKK